MLVLYFRISTPHAALNARVAYGILRIDDGESTVSDLDGVDFQVVTNVSCKRKGQTNDQLAAA